MTALRSPLVWLAYVLGLLAVAGLVHGVTLLATPSRAAHDAFARVSAATAPGAMTRLKSAVEDRTTPFRDAAMALAICRYDLKTGPLRLDVTPLEEGFVSIGMHSRKGFAFYGLDLGAADRSPMTMVLMTAAQRAQAEEADSDDEPSQDLRITAPEAEGFVTVETPATNAAAADEALGHVRCAAAQAAETGSRP